MTCRVEDANPGNLIRRRPGLRRQYRHQAGEERKENQAFDLSVHSPSNLLKRAADPGKAIADDDPTRHSHDTVIPSTAAMGQLHRSSF